MPIKFIVTESLKSWIIDYIEYYYFSSYNRVEWNYSEIKQIICNNGYIVIVTINNNIYVNGLNSCEGLEFCKKINKIDNFTKLINLPFPNYDLYEIRNKSQELGIIYEIKLILYLDRDIMNYVFAGNEFVYFYFKELNNEGDELLVDFS
ncbi:hypothetical protein ABK040_006138 [Willaertia magna]